MICESSDEINKSFVVYQFVILTIVVNTTYDFGLVIFGSGSSNLKGTAGFGSFFRLLWVSYFDPQANMVFHGFPWFSMMFKIFQPLMMRKNHIMHLMMLS